MILAAKKSAKMSPSDSKGLTQENWICSSCNGKVSDCLGFLIFEHSLKETNLETGFDGCEGRRLRSRKDSQRIGLLVPTYMRYLTWHQQYLIIASRGVSTAYTNDRAASRSLERDRGSPEVKALPKEATSSRRRWISSGALGVIAIWGSTSIFVVAPFFDAPFNFPLACPLATPFAVLPFWVDTDMLAFEIVS